MVGHNACAVVASLGGEVLKESYSNKFKIDLCTRYAACTTREEKLLLAESLGLSIEMLFNLWSRWEGRVR